MGCVTANIRSTKSPDFRPLKGDNLVVLPLKYSGTGRDYDGADEALSFELLSQGFKIVERSQLNRVLKELNFSRSAYADPTTISQLGRQLSVKEVIIGTWRGSYPLSELNVRVVDVETGNVIWAAKSRVDISLSDQRLGLEASCKKIAAEFRGVFSTHLENQ